MLPGLESTALADAARAPTTSPDTSIFLTWSSFWAINPDDEHVSKTAAKNDNRAMPALPLLVKQFTTSIERMVMGLVILDHSKDSPQRNGCKKANRCRKKFYAEIIHTGNQYW